MTQSFGFSHFPISSKEARSHRNITRTTNANHVQFYIPSSHVVNETCEIHFNNTFYLTPRIRKYYRVNMWSVRTVTPLRAYLWALLAPSMPREGWGQLGSATSAPLPNHEGGFPLDPKKEKGGNFSASSFALKLLDMPPMSGTHSLERAQCACASLHLPPRAPPSSRSTSAFSSPFGAGQGHSPTYFPLCEATSVLLLLLRLK